MQTVDFLLRFSLNPVSTIYTFAAMIMVSVSAVRVPCRRCMDVSRCLYRNPSFKFTPAMAHCGRCLRQTSPVDSNLGDVDLAPSTNCYDRANGGR